MKPNLRYFFAAIIGFISLTFFLIPHTKIINRPLIGLHDMNNGHLLTTTLIWRQEGIAKHHFAPIYSFSPGDINLRSWGLVGKNNRMYHASYPPLSFWLVYLTSYLPGVGVSEPAARLTSLGVFITALVFLFIYLLITYNLSTAVFGSGLFSLVPASVYFFGGVIIADIAVFAFWIPAFVLLAFYKRYRQRLLAYLFLLALSLAVLTEWLGLLASIGIFIYLCVGLIRKNSDSRKGGLKNPRLLGGIAMSTLLSLLITTAVYLTIATPENFIKYLINKYINRGNTLSSFTALAQQNNLKPSLVNGIKIWLNRVLNGYLWHEWTPFFWFIIIGSLIVFFILILLWLKNGGRNQLLNSKIAQIRLDNGLIFSLLIFPPLLHTLLLSSFHYLHDYSFLSYLPALSIISAKGFFVASSLIEQRLNYRWKKLRLLSLTVGVGVLLLFYTTAQNTYHFFFVDQTGGWTSTINLFTATRKATRPDDLILTSHSYNPDMWFYLRRNVIQWIKKKEDLDGYKGYYSLFQRVFYVADYRPFYDAVCESKPTKPVAHGWMCRIK